MASSDQFAATTRYGTRKGNRGLVVSMWLEGPLPAGQTPSTQTKQVGFVVGKRQIPKSVNRNKVKRRLRHLMRDRIDALPAGAQVVIRALPASADMSYQKLGKYLDLALAGAAAKAIEKNQKRNN